MKPLHLPLIEALDLRHPRDLPIYVSLDVGPDGDVSLAVWLNGELREVVPVPRPLAALGAHGIAEAINLQSSFVVAALPAPPAVRVVRPPGVWPWVVDQLLDVRAWARGHARRWALGQLERHGIRCRCGLQLLPGDADATRDGVTCVGCRRFIGGIVIARAYGRPVRTVLFGV